MRLDKTLLTIVTITLNDKDNLIDTVNSIIYQITDEVEYIVKDGESTDGSEEYLNNYSDLIRVIRKKDTGIYDAMNQGLYAANGEYIMYINSGDCLKNESLGEILQKLKEKPDCIMGGVENVIQIENNRYIKRIQPDRNINHLKNGMICCHQSFVARKDIIEKMGGFDTSFRVAGDWDLISRIYKKERKTVFCDDPFVTYDVYGLSSTSHIRERHVVRKKNQYYKFIDFYYFMDCIHDALSKLVSVLLGEQMKHKIAVKLKGYILES